MADETKTPRGVKDIDAALSEFQGETQPAVVAGKAVKGTVKKAAKPRRKSVKQVSVQKGKRKEAIARARLVSGSGEVIVNGIRAELMKPHEISELIMEPLRVSHQAREIMAGSKIIINVSGGGISGQAQAARNALAKTLVMSSGSEALKKTFLDYDRSMLVDDHRRVEPKKFLGTKARARFQTSYR